MSVADLALFGGLPDYSTPLHVGRPSEVDRQRLQRRIDGALDRAWLTNDGPLVHELESRMAEFIGVDHCIVVANGTLGLQLVAKCLGITGSVVVPAFTFIGTASAMSWIGVEPVFCDVDLETHNLSPDDVVRRAPRDVGAILGVHLWGRACDVDGLKYVARKLDAHLLFDAAHAIGCGHQGRHIGGFGVAEVFSLHATKMVTALEGGVVATNDADLAERIRHARNFGFGAKGQVVAIGVNAKMNEFSAAMGLTSLEAYEPARQHNAALHAAYANALNAVSGIDLIKPDNNQWNYHYAVLQLSEPDAKWRDLLLRILWSENILARSYFAPGIHRTLPYQNSANGPKATNGTDELVNSRILSDTLITLPTGSQIKTEDAAAIGDLIRFCYAHRGEIEAEAARRGDTLKGLSDRLQISPASTGR